MTAALTGPTGFGDYMAVGDFDGYVHWLSEEDGSFVAAQAFRHRAVMRRHRWRATA